MCEQSSYITSCVAGSTRVLKRTAKPSQHLPDINLSFVCHDELTIEVPSVFSYANIDDSICCVQYRGHCSLLCEEHSNVYDGLCASKRNEIKIVPNGKREWLAKATHSYNGVDESFALVVNFSSNPQPAKFVSNITLNCVGARPLRVSILSSFRSDSQLRSFIGVSFCLLESLTKLILEFCDQDLDDSSLSIQDRVFLVLCKLKLNVSFSFLSSLFSIERHNCCVIFSQMLPMLSIVLKCTIYWPSKEEVIENMPGYYEKFKDTRVVLDCLEIPVNSVQCPKCCLILNSGCLGRQAVKILIGFSPSGLITFISKVYGNKTSVEEIFFVSDLCSNNLIDPYMDAVMVGKGCYIDRICDERYIRVYHAPFAEGDFFPSDCTTNPLRASDDDKGVNVESTIKRMKSFKILKNKLCSSLIPFADDILNTIAGLVNLHA